MTAAFALRYITLRVLRGFFRFCAIVIVHLSVLPTGKFWRNTNYRNLHPGSSYFGHKTLVEVKRRSEIKDVNIQLRWRYSE